eukprot:10348702-Karenia_brevis.AAC.1
MHATSVATRCLECNGKGSGRAFFRAVSKCACVSPSSSRGKAHARMIAPERKLPHKQRPSHGRRM